LRELHLGTEIHDLLRRPEAQSRVGDEGREVLDRNAELKLARVIGYVGADQ